MNHNCFKDFICCSLERNISYIQCYGYCKAVNIKKMVLLKPGSRGVCSCEYTSVTHQYPIFSGLSTTGHVSTGLPSNK